MICVVASFRLKFPKQFAFARLPRRVIAKAGDEPANYCHVEPGSDHDLWRGPVG